MIDGATPDRRRTDRFDRELSWQAPRIGEDPDAQRARGLKRGCLALLLLALLAGAIAGALWQQEQARRAALREAFAALAREVSEPGAASRWELVERLELQGPIAVIDVGEAALSELHFALPEARRGDAPGQVETLILVALERPGSSVSASGGPLQREAELIGRLRVVDWRGERCEPDWVILKGAAEVDAASQRIRTPGSVRERLAEEVARRAAGRGDG